MLVHPGAGDASLVGGAIQIAGGVADQAAAGIAAIGAASEGMHYRLAPAGTQLENNTSIFGTAAVGGAVEISACIAEQRCVRRSSAREILKGTKYRIRRR